MGLYSMEESMHFLLELFLSIMELLGEKSGRLNMERFNHFSQLIVHTYQLFQEGNLVQYYNATVMCYSPKRMRH